MEAPYLQSRLELLRKTQNPDGGWGYFPAKASWFEPTFYAMLVLHGDPANADAYEKAWGLVRSWQTKDGGWRPSGQVDVSSWVTAFGVTLCAVNGVNDDGFQRGVRWLLETAGAGNNILTRVAQRVTHSTTVDVRLDGWPWLPGTANWIEPTSHAIIALHKASVHFQSAKLNERIDVGQRMILNRRCKDGGWNYGNPSVFRSDLPSYPETTALGLIGVQACTKDQVSPSLELAKQLQTESRSPMAQAWLTICLRSYGIDPAAAPPRALSSDILLAALEALGAPDGNHRLLRIGETA